MNQQIPQQQQNINLDLSSAADVECSACKGKFFQPVVFFKKISALLSPTGKEAIVPIDTFACSECGNIDAIFLPKGVAPNSSTPPESSLLLG